MAEEILTEAWNDIFVKRDHTLMMELGSNEDKCSSWIGLKDFPLITNRDNDLNHLITIDLSTLFTNTKNQSISIYFKYQRAKIAEWITEINETVLISDPDILEISCDSYSLDENSIPWMKKAGHGIQRSKIGGKPAFMQENIATSNDFLLQINWDDLVFDANQALGKNFNLASEAMMGGNLYLFGSVNSLSHEIDLNEINVYHQYL